jgi:serine/threonine protein kinase/formylglycine-generating enzyme required for sulfatase activity
VNAERLIDRAHLLLGLPRTLLQQLDRQARATGYSLATLLVEMGYASTKDIERILTHRPAAGPIRDGSTPPAAFGPVGIAAEEHEPRPRPRTFPGVGRNTPSVPPVGAVPVPPSGPRESARPRAFHRARRSDEAMADTFELDGPLTPILVSNASDTFDMDMPDTPSGIPILGPYVDETLPPVGVPPPLRGMRLGRAVALGDGEFDDGRAGRIPVLDTYVSDTSDFPILESQDETQHPTMRARDDRGEPTIIDGRSVVPELADGSARYALGDVIAQGGMGYVIEAIDQNIGRVVAMKQLQTRHESNPGLQLRFVEEAQITGQLQHPNIVPVYELGVRAGGALFFTMKRVEGRTLREVIKGLRGREPDYEAAFGRIRLLQAFQQVNMAIAYAHSRGVIHRDLKPSNIMFGDYGEVLVMDWGLAKITGPGRGDAVHSHRQELKRWSTKHGDVIGTPGYMAPELALGQVDDVDVRVDVYSLGAILYEILALRPPYGGVDGKSVVRKMLTTRVTPPSKRAPSRDIPRELEEVCLRCLAKERDQRFSSVMEIHAAVQAHLEGELDQQRRETEARRHLGEARTHALEYQRLSERAERLREALESRRMGLTPWGGLEERRPVWAAERALADAEMARRHAFEQADLGYARALGRVEGFPDARDGRGTLHWSAFLAAEHEGDAAGCARSADTLRHLDAARYAGLLKGNGELSIETTPPNAGAVLYTFQADDAVLRAVKPVSLGETPLGVESLAMGSYLLVLRADDRSETRVPIYISRLANVNINIRLRPESEIPPGMAYIPGGRMRLGGDAEAQRGFARRLVEVDDFCLSRLPVTFGDYVEFLDALNQADPDTARLRAPRLFADGPSLLPMCNGRFLLPSTSTRALDAQADWPVFGISLDDALAFCDWKSMREGVSYRLPSETEWETAARGADARFFPWGNTWEPTYCNSAHARSGPPCLEPCGNYPTDRSPYGILDLAGGVSDWTISSPRQRASEDLRVCRGGSWQHLDLRARLASRHLMWRSAVSVSVGFRLAFDPR